MAVGTIHGTGLNSVSLVIVTVNLTTTTTTNNKKIHAQQNHNKRKKTTTTTNYYTMNKILTSITHKVSLQMIENKQLHMNISTGQLILCSTI